jgi:hypothetical protein
LFSLEAASGSSFAVFYANYILESSSLSSCEFYFFTLLFSVRVDLLEFGLSGRSAFFILLLF